MAAKNTKTKKKNSKSSNLHELLLVKMGALLDVENELIKALPKLAKKSTNKDLKAGFESHLKETKEHAKRLEQAFKELGEKPKKVKGDAIRGLKSDADWVVANVVVGPALDANLIAAAQYVELYETAGYGAALEWAKLMGQDVVADLLTQTLEEEKAADKKLNDLATSKINEEANVM